MSRNFRWTVTIISIVLGVVLVYASYHKIADPPDFAKIIYNYHLFPAAMIHPLAIFVPWLEAIAGLSLATGVLRRGGALLASLFFLSFIAFLSVNLARDCPTICGCFSTHADGSSLTDAEKFFEMKKELALDVLLFAGSVLVLVGSHRIAKAKAKAKAEAA